ncbi:dTDP-glucose 4,6-dehydratase (plasmid) [Streptomyces sp. Q6]|uniref:dTDP-glucose 4,6-dehydratase n=1 Tax=Streptomyces citrinus TaxID=3118173 RepID=A0ACD5ARA8_9ACTN
MDNILVTGGAGFIGSHFVKRLLERDDVATVTVLDTLTYAGHKANLSDSFISPKLNFERGNILDQQLVDELVQRHDYVVNFAAESHVDRSFFEAGTFLATNVLGTHVLLDAAHRKGIERFVHVSTDEVYGPLPKGHASEAYPLRPTVPYAASKAASDLIALSYHQTFGVPVCVTRSSNNYGPAQHPEKVIPRFISHLLNGEPCTLHGSGQHIRNWLHVEDNCQGIELVLREGTPGEVYNIGGGTDLTNKDLTGLILSACGADWSQVSYVEDRRSNDVRYAMDWSKVRELGYRPRRDMEEGLAETVQWYRDHPERRAPALRDPESTLPEISLAKAAERGITHV